MGVPANADLEYWQNVLVAGGSTAIPRWTLDPAPGSAERTVKIPQDAVAALRGLADELAVSSVRCCWPRMRRCSPRCRGSATS